MGRHALGEDVSAAKRRVGAGARAVVRIGGHYSERPVGDEALDMKASFLRWEGKHAGEGKGGGPPQPFRAGGPIVSHFLLIVTPEWVAETGDVHSRDNPRVRALMGAARDWARAHQLGDVIHCRYDVDEAGSGVVDLACVPVYEHKSKGYKYVGVNRSHLDLAKRRERPNLASFAVLQDTWAETLQAVDPTIQRGELAKKTGRRHESPDRYKIGRDTAIAAERKRLEAEAKGLALREAAAARREASLRDEGARVDADRSRLDRVRSSAAREARAILGIAAKKPVRGTQP